MNLREWRESKGWDQSDLAAKLGKPRPTYQKMEAGKAPIRPKEQEKIRKMGYTGLWPREEPQEAAAPAGGPYVTEKAFAEEHGYWKGKFEALEKRVDDQKKVVDELLRGYQAHIVKAPDKAHPEPSPQ